MRYVRKTAFLHQIWFLNPVFTSNPVARTAWFRLNIA